MFELGLWLGLAVFDGQLPGKKLRSRNHGFDCYGRSFQSKDSGKAVHTRREVVKYYLLPIINDEHEKTKRTRTRLGDRSFSVAGPCLWNSLPVALLDSLRDFWRHFSLCRAAVHSDCCFFCAVYKYSYLLTYLLTIRPGRWSSHWPCLTDLLVYPPTGSVSSESMTTIPPMSRHTSPFLLFSINAIHVYFVYE